MGEGTIEQAEPRLLRIAIERIRSNPNNPRKVMTEEAIGRRMASLKSSGMKTPVKVRTLTGDERGSEPGHDYELVGGQIRVEAAKRLGWREVTALVLPVADSDALLEGILDNQADDLYWLESHEGFEVVM